MVVEVGSSADIVPTLKDCYGNPVGGVKVKLVVGDRTRIVRTDSHGKISFARTVFSPVEYKISIRSSGVDSTYAESKAYAKLIFCNKRIDTTLTVPDMILIGNSSDVVATLRDSDGNAVSGVKVKIAVGNLTVTDLTDENGQVSLDISDLAPGQYKISARSSGLNVLYRESKAYAKLIVSEDKLNTTLTIPNVIVIGEDVVVATLKDCYGNIISGVNVKVAVGNLTETVKTDANGRVHMNLSGLDPGEYVISARSSGVSEIYKEAKVSASTLISKDKLNTTLTVNDVVVKKDDDAVVAVYLKDDYGNPINGVKVKIVVGDSKLIYKTSGQGVLRWAISYFDPGVYKISARSSGVDIRYAESKAYAKLVVYT